MSDPTTQNAPETQSLELVVQKTIELPTTVHSLDLSLDETTLFAACFDGGIYAVDLESGKAELFARHDSYASGIKRIPGSNLAVSAGYDGVLLWHDLETKQQVRRIDAHRFWSWDLAVTSDGRAVASVTGQYCSGNMKYAPAPAEEPTVKLFDAQSGKLQHQFDLLPSVQAVTFSPDGQFLAAGNLMGDVRIWNASTGEELAAWNSPDFTSWGTSKSAHYSYGIFGLCFTPDGQELLACGIGPMYDPIAVNGKQTWQRFAWKESPVRTVDEIHQGDHGGGVMETLAFHPSDDWFVMAGRVSVGKWNLSVFDAKSGDQLTALDVKGARLTEALFSEDGSHLFLSGGLGQERKKDGQYPSFGRIVIAAFSTDA